MANGGGSMNKHNQRQSSKNKGYYDAQYARTERNKKRNKAKEAAEQRADALKAFDKHWDRIDGNQKTEAE